jgi:uncharacterized Zn finger protein (UPF0148 family)
MMNDGKVICPCCESAMFKAETKPNWSRRGETLYVYQCPVCGYNLSRVKEDKK